MIDAIGSHAQILSLAINRKKIENNFNEREMEVLTKLNCSIIYNMILRDTKQSNLAMFDIDISTIGEVP